MHPRPTLLLVLAALGMAGCYESIPPGDDDDTVADGDADTDADGDADGDADACRQRPPPTRSTCS